MQIPAGSFPSGHALNLTTIFGLFILGGARHDPAVARSLPAACGLMAGMATAL
jgi:hypothetical protein